MKAVFIDRDGTKFRYTSAQPIQGYRTRLLPEQGALKLAVLRR